MKLKSVKLKRFCAALAVVLLLSACGGAVAKDQEEDGRWRVSNVIGSVKAGDEIRLQDDFAAAADKDLIVNATLGSGSFYDVRKSVLNKKKALLEGNPSEGAPMEVKKFADLASDWGARNEDGVEPLRPYLEAIESISSIEDLTAYECDRERNLFGLGVLMPLSVGQSGVDPAVCTATIGFPDFSLGEEGEYTALNAAGLEKREAVNKITEHVLTGLGYSKDKVQKLLVANYRFEKKLAHSVTYLSAEESKEALMDRDKCISEADGYPIGQILDAWGYPSDGSYTMNPKEAKKAAALYSEKNLEDIKGMLTVHLVTLSASYLDRETFDLQNKLAVSRLEKESEDIPQTKEEEEMELLFDGFLGTGMAGVILDKMYLDAYADRESVEKLEELTRDILGQFRDLIGEETWLSEEGKEACISKLEALKPHVAVPDFECLDLSGFHVRSRAEGGSFLQAAAASRMCLKTSEAVLCSRPYDRNLWIPSLYSTTQTNAFYSPSENGIYILKGILEPPFYYAGMSYEEILGGIGVIIGHEITHGFDKSGSEYNKDGIKESWLPFDDLMAFSDRCDRVAEYYRTIRPFPGGAAYDGSRVTGEATADMGGLRITLALAAKKKDFDFDAYFRQYARVWFECITKDSAVSSFDTDEHPLNYLRVNVGLQQFDEFVKTYGIKEGDGMYLLDEKRIPVW